MQKALSITVGLSLVLAGCAIGDSVSEGPPGIVRTSYQELVKKLGQPSRVVSFDNSHKIAVYNKIDYEKFLPDFMSVKDYKSSMISFEGKFIFDKNDNCMSSIYGSSSVSSSYIEFQDPNRGKKVRDVTNFLMENKDFHEKIAVCETKTGISEAEINFINNGTVPPP